MVKQLKSDRKWELLKGVILFLTPLIIMYWFIDTTMREIISLTESVYSPVQLIMNNMVFIIVFGGFYYALFKGVKIIKEYVSSYRKKR
ncbi:hypothetical protein [uncultured Enterococcus sp.]|uniref:hypothetical protein n=1 Tax=uncultured Enterococcus sp. TaxID=167972 RepID=UPI002AA636EC|nr:hypothetical protein [uncultured Enterococcus sp.]